MQPSRFAQTSILAAVCLFWIGLPAFAQTDGNPSQALSTYMQEVREGKVFQRISPDITLAKTYGAKLIPDLKEYAKDPDDRVAYTAFSILSAISHRSESLSDRQLAVEALLPLLDDRRLAQSVFDASLEWRSIDFSESARHFLTQRLREKRSPIAPTVLAMGTAGMTSEIPHLAEFLASPPLPGGEPIYWHHGLAWAALRARARLGVQEDIQKCIDIVVASSDKETKANRLFLSLAYVRQPQVAKYLIGYLNDDTVVQHPASLDGSDPGQRTQIAGRAAEALATMLEGFPKKYPRSHISQENLTECRQWVAAQKELKLIR